MWSKVKANFEHNLLIEESPPFKAQEARNHAQGRKYLNQAELTGEFKKIGALYKQADGFPEGPDNDEFEDIDDPGKNSSYFEIFLKITGPLFE